jgi:SAM-dependent methyltransferase
MLKRFVAWNVAAADFIEDRLPTSFTRSLLHFHELAAARLIEKEAGLKVLDMGGGHMTPFAKHRRDGAIFLVGADILLDQVRNNHEIDAGLVCDACATLPFRDASFDVVATRSVLEHLRDNAVFVAECSRILKSGGKAIHVFPTRRAPFAMLNRVIPNAVVRWAMRNFFPQWVDECGFRAYYDVCGYPEMARLHIENGFAVEELQLRYYQSIYFKPFLPIYLVSLAYDLALWAIDARWLSCQMVLVARRS